MKSKISFINRGIFRNDIRRFAWIGALYFLALAVTVPLQLLMIHTRPEAIKVNYTASNYLQVLDFSYAPFTYLLLMAIPVLTGLLIFRYLQSGPAADMEHALPIRRESLFNTHVLSGALLLALPLVAVALITLGLKYGLSIDLLQNRDIAVWLGVSLLSNILLFMTTVAVGMFTGLSTLQGVLTYILLIVPYGLSYLIIYNLKMYLYGFPDAYYSSNAISAYSPLLRLTEYVSQPLAAGEVTVYLLICLALYFIGRVLYRRRKTESAGNAITFDLLRPLFKYAVTFSTMLLVGTYFYSSQDSMAWTYWGYGLGAVLGYFISEILLHKSFNVFEKSQIRNLAVYGLVIAAGIGVLSLDWTRYEQRLPALEDIESVYMDDSFYPLTYNADDNRFSRYYSHQRIYTDPDNIAAIHLLHQALIAKGADTELTEHLDQQMVCLAYQLNNGKKFYRNYFFAPAEFEEQIKPLYESREYKFHQHELLRLKPAVIQLIDLNSYRSNKHIRISDPDMISAAVAALQVDLYAANYEQMKDSRPPWGYVNFTLSPNPTMADAPGPSGYYNLNVNWNKSYIHFEEWLKKAGLYEQARLLPGEDIIHAIIKNVPEGMNHNSYRNFLEANRESSPNDLKITDSEQLEVCLSTYRDDYVEGPFFIVDFQLRNGSTISGILTPQDAPAWVKEHFRKE